MHAAARKASLHVEPGTPPITGHELEHLLSHTAGWEVEDGVLTTDVPDDHNDPVGPDLEPHMAFAMTLAVGLLIVIADFYDDEVDAAVDALTAAIEPVMIVLMGTMVGGMLVAMYLPMFSLISKIG